MNALTLEVEVDGKIRRVAMERHNGGWLAHIDGRMVPIDIRAPMPGVLSLLLDGRSYRCVRTVFADEETIAVGGQEHRVAVSDPRSLRGRRKRTASGNGTLHMKASMPGRVARVMVVAGETVAAHQGILVIEAMKMQNELKTPREGRVAEVRVAAGDTVTAGQVLAVIE
jgi:biotin carboxyl carrier protein